MLTNPINKNISTRSLYIAAWTLISGLQITMVGSHINEQWQYLIFDILSFNAMLALLLLSVWHPINHVHWSSKYWYNYAVGHLFCALILAAICLCINKIAMWIVVDNYSVYMHQMRHVYGGRFVGSIIMYLVTVLTYYLYIFVKRVQEKQVNEIRLSQIIKTNELNLLKSQINPHFLFNSLNSLNSLIMNDTAQAQKMLLALSDYLRYSVLSNNNPYSSLSQEISNIERYLSIEKLRFGSRLSYEFSIPEQCCRVQIPSMLLQPLFENAVKHSVYESLQDVTITAVASASDDTLEIVITNPYDSHQSSSTGTGTGLSNIRERLWLIYEQAAGLHTEISEGKHIAVLRLPIRY
jgi:sensor histidine kinase YesM